MANDIEKLKFVDKAGLEQFWADVQKYLTRNYRGLPAGMQFSQIFQSNGQLHVLVEPFGGQGDERKEASRTSLGVYSKDEVKELISDNGSYLGQMSLAEINAIPQNKEPHNGDIINIKFNQATDEPYIDPNNHHFGIVINKWDGAYEHSSVKVADGDNVIYDKKGLPHVWDRQAGEYKVKQDATSVDFDEYKVILNISQDENGEISVTQQTIPTATVEKLGLTTLAGVVTDGDTVNDKAATPKAVAEAIAAKIRGLDVAGITGSTSKTITSISETDGLIDATYEDILVGTSNIDTGVVTTVKLADKAVTTDKINDKAVTTDKIDDKAVTTSKIDDDAVTTAKIDDGAVTSAKIANGTIQTEDIADSQITTAKIADSAVTTGKIAHDAVNGDKIADDAIGNEHIAANAVQEEQILDGSVTNSKIDDGAVTYEKVTNDTEHPFPIDISGNAANATHADDASHADVADDVSEGSALDQRLDTIEADISDLDDAKADKVTGATAGNFASLDAEGNLVDSGHKHADYKTVQAAVPSPEVPQSGTTTSLSFIDTVSQNANGEISATKKSVPKSDAIDLNSSDTLATSAAVKAAVEASHSEVTGLNCADQLSLNGHFNKKYITRLSQLNGQMSYDSDSMAEGPTENSAAPVTGHALYTEHLQRSQFDEWVRSLIPGVTTPSNQLADKAYVDAIGERLEARYLSAYDAEHGQYIPFPTYAAFEEAADRLIPDQFYYNGVAVSELGDGKLDNNDVIVITADETHLNEINEPSTTRYRYQCDVATGDNGHWYFEYVINNTALNAAQLLAINSGITAEYKASYDNHLASQGQDPNHTNPHHVTFDQLLGRNGVDSTELGVLDGVDTDHIGAAQINTLRDIGEEDPVQGTIQYQLNDKMERIDPASSEPGYTVSNKIAVVNDHDLVNGRFGVKDSGAEITQYYSPNDTVNPATGSAIHQAIEALEGTHSSTEDKLSITVATDQHGIIDAVTIDDSGLATAAQGTKADTAVQTVTLNGTTLSGNDIDLGNLKTTQTAKADPEASGETLVAIDSITQDANGEITATKKNIQSATTSVKGVVQLAGSIGAEVLTENNKAASERAVRDAINDLNVNEITGGAGKTVTAISESAGKISATVADIAIMKSQVTDFSHDHGNITNAGTIGSEANKALVTAADGHIVAGDIDGTYSVDNKIATVSTVSSAIEDLDYTDSAVTNQFVTSVSETDGVIAVTRAQPGITDIDGLSDRLDGVDTSISSLDTRKADKVVPAAGVDLEGHLATLDSTGNLEDSGYHVVNTYKVSDDKSAYLANPVTGTAVDAAIAESASGDRQYVDEKIAGLDATESSSDQNNVQVTVTQVDGVITGVSVEDNSANQDDIDDTVEAAIEDLDATVSSSDQNNVQVTVTEEDGVITGVSVTDHSANQDDIDASIANLDAEVTSTDGTNVQVKVTEVDGVVTAVNVTTDNTINASNLTAAIEALDAEETSTDGTNVQFKVTEVDGVVTGVNITTDNTINATDLTTAINALDAEEISTDGKNVQFQVTETDGKITGVSVTTDNTVNATDVGNAITTAINGLDSNATSIDGTNVQVKVTEVDGKISAVNITSDNTVNSTDVSNAITTAIDNLDIQAITGSTSKTITSISETNGLIDATFEDILVGTSNIDTGAVTTEKIAAEAVTTAKLYDKAVTTDKINDKAVTTGKIDDEAVTTGKIADDAVTTAKIADEAVTTAKIDDEAVTTAKIDDEAVTTAKIDDEAVTTAKLDDGAVTYEKVTNDAEHPFPIDISGNASTATTAATADRAYDIVDGGTLDTRIEGIESNVDALQTGKADKVVNAVSGNFAGLDANGNLTDSGVNANTFKTKQTAQTNTGSSLKTATKINQNANGELDVEFSDIQSATTGQKGVVQLAGSIGATVASENNKAASEKAVRDAIDSAIGGTIESLDVEEVGGAGKYISAISETDGKISATATTMDTAPTSASTNAVTSGGVYTAINSAVDALDATVSGSSTNVSVSVTETDGKLASITVSDTAATSDHVHGNISNDGKVGTAANKVLVTTTGGEVVAGDIDGTYNASTNKIATQSTVTSAINALDVSDISGFGTDKTLATLTETDGKIAASFQPIQIAESQVTGLEIDLEGIDDALDTKEDKASKVTSWSATTTDTSYPSEKLVKDSLDTKVDKTTKVNGHALSGDVTVTKGDVGLGSVVNTGDSDTPVSGGTTKFTTGGAYTELAKKADKTATVSNVAYDGTGKKITKTINGTTSDVVSAATLKADMALDNVANTNITVSASDGVTDNTNHVTYKYEHPTTTDTAAAAVKVGKDAMGHVVLGAALTKEDVGLDLVENQTITVTSSSVSDGTHTFDKYVHPTTTAHAAAAVKVGNDGTGHVVLGAALTKDDVGLGLVENQTITVTGTSVSDGTNTFNKYVHPTTTDTAAAAVKVGKDALGHVVIGAALGKSDVGLGNVSNDAQVKRSEMGVAGGVATLDNEGKVPAAQLPSYVDDIAEGYLYNGTFYTDSAHTDPMTATSGKIYVDIPTNMTYRWSGTAYVKVASDLALGETSSTAYRGDRGKTAYDHSQLTSGNPHNVTAADVGLGNVANTKITVSATDGVKDNTNNVTYKYTHPTTTAVAASAKKVGYDNQGHVVLGDALTKGDVSLGNVDNTSDATKKTNFTGSIASGNTGFVTGGDAYTELNKKADKTATVSTVTYDTTGKKITKTINGTTTDVVTAAKLKEDMALDLVKNQAITVTSTSVSDGTNTFNKYTHPTYTAATAAAVKVGRDSTGHVTIGTALGKGDVGLGNVDNTSDDTKKANFTGAVASGNTGFPTGDAVFQAIAANGKGYEIVDTTNTYADVKAIYDAGKIPVFHESSDNNYAPLHKVDASGANPVFWFNFVKLSNNASPMSDIEFKRISCQSGSYPWVQYGGGPYLENTNNKVASWSSTTTDDHYPSEKLVKTALDGKASSTHTHGNITNAGALQTNDVTIASGDKLVITDSSDSNKVARASAAFDGSTTTKALTQKGTFEDFAKQADIDEAIEDIPTISLVGDNHITVTSDDTTGTVTVATDIAAQTAYTAKGSATKVPQITTNALGQVTGITEVTISGVTPASHPHGNITNDGKIGSTADLAVVTGTSGAVTTADLSTAAPSASGTTTSFIDTVSQSSNGKITATKKTIASASTSAQGIVQLAGSIGTTVSSENNKAASEKAVRDAINALDVDSSGGAGKYISAISETNGKISATATTMDTTPTANSTNAITSGGVASALTGYKPVQTAKSSPSASGNTLAFIDTISQDANGVITATKKNVTIDSALSSTSTNPVQNKVVQSALDTKTEKLFASSTVPASGTMYIKITNAHGVALTGILAISCPNSHKNGEWLLHTYGNTEVRSEVNVIGNLQMLDWPWYVNDSEFYVKASNTNTESGLSIVAQFTKLLYTTQAVTLQIVDTLPSTATQMTVTGVKYSERLRTARQLAVNLANTATDTSFDGSADQTGIKVSGTLPIANGGTGATTAENAEYNLLTHASTSISSALEDSHRILFAYTSPSASTGRIAGYRTASSLWTYVKGKMSSDTGVNISGNAATATTATTATNYNTSSGTIKTALDGKISKVSNTTVNDGVSTTWVKYGSRQLTVDGSSIMLDMSTQSDGWAGSFAGIKDSTSTYAMLGYHGNVGNFLYAYMMGTYADPAFKITGDGIATFKNSLRVPSLSNKAGTYTYTLNSTKGGELALKEDVPAAVSVKGNAETTYRTGQVNLTPANLGISATSTSVTVGSTTFNKYSHPAGNAPSVTGFPADGGTLAFGGTFDVNQVSTDSTSHVSSITKRTFTLPSLGTTSTTAAKGDHTHTASIAADTGTSALAMTANTKYKLTAGGTTFIFTTPVDTTYSSKTAASGGTDVSLVTTGEKWTWNHKQDALTEMTTAEVSNLVAAFAS